MKRLAAAADVTAEITFGLGRLDGRLQRTLRVRVFHPQIDIALRRTHSQSGDGHALDQHEGITLHDHAVGVGARIALVGVADDVLLRGLRIHAGFPLDAGRKGCAAAAAQPRVGHRLNHLGTAHAERIFQTAIAAVRTVVVEAARIDDADAGKGQALLAFQIADLFGRPQAQGVMAGVQKIRVEQPGDIVRLHRAKGDAALRRCDFDHRFQPVQAARSVADDPDIEIALPGFRRDGDGHGFRAER